MSMKNKQHRSKNKICFLKEKEDIMTEEAVWGLTRGNEGEEDEVVTVISYPLLEHELLSLTKVLP